MRPDWCAPRIAGVSGIGEDERGGLRFADNAVIAPQFNSGQPGRYAIDVIVVGVPMSADKRPFFDVAAWNASIAAAGHSGVTVERVEFVNTGAAANPRSTGGKFDIFGWGVDVADYTYRLIMNVRPQPGSAGVGAITTAGWFLIGAAVVAVNLLVFKLTGTDVLVTAIKYIGSLAADIVGEVGVPIAGAAAKILIPALVVVGLALLAFSKMGGKASYKGISLGGK
jgi:hypothetical protein